MHLRTEKAICRRVCEQKRQFSDASADRSGNLRTHLRTEMEIRGRICGQLRGQKLRFAERIAETSADDAADKAADNPSGLPSHRSNFDCFHTCCLIRTAPQIFLRTLWDALQTGLRTLSWIFKRTHLRTERGSAQTDLRQLFAHSKSCERNCRMHILRIHFICK